MSIENIVLPQTDQVANLTLMSEGILYTPNQIQPSFDNVVDLSGSYAPVGCTTPGCLALYPLQSLWTDSASSAPSYLKDWRSIVRSWAIQEHKELLLESVNCSGS